MKAPSIASRILIVLLSTLALALSGTLAWATVNDFQSRGVVPLGVRIAEAPLGGMTEAAARVSIEAAVSTPLLRPITVNADGKDFTLDPKNILSVDVDGMIADAYAPRRSSPFVGRLRNQLAGEPLPANIEPRFAVDAETLSVWITGIAAQTDRPATDAEMLIDDGAIVMTRSVTGRRLDASATIAAITGALTSEAALTGSSARSVRAVVSDVVPSISESTFGKALVVDVSERRIRLYNNMELEKAYRCAVGTPQFPTPKGSFKIVEKRYRPTWRNPGSGWAKDMPASIGPGSGNPLGTRALNLDSPGIRVHGTSKNFSIGTAASHGCIRMHMWDVEDLYPRIPVGTPIFIVR